MEARVWLNLQQLWDFYQAMHSRPREPDHAATRVGPHVFGTRVRLIVDTLLLVVVLANWRRFDQPAPGVSS
jgi:hypothetical protein